MKTNLIIGLLILLTLFAFQKRGKGRNEYFLSTSELFPQTIQGIKGAISISSADTIMLVEKAEMDLPDTIHFELLTGSITTHKLVLDNLSDKEMSLDISMKYHPQNNYALEFDGTDGYVYCGNDKSLYSDGSFTLESWVYITDSTRNNTGDADSCREWWRWNSVCQTNH